MTRKTSTFRHTVEEIRSDGTDVSRRTRRDVLATEEPLEIRVVRAEDVRPGRPVRETAHRVAVTMRTPGSDFELAAGFLFGEGIIRGADDVRAIRYCVDSEQDGEQQFNIVNVFLSRTVEFDPSALQRNFYTTSSCGVCGKASIEAVQGPACERLSDPVVVDVRSVLALPEALREAQRVFERTGGLHAAGLFSADGELLRAREDVGRHNALDKLVGAALLNGEVPLVGRIALMSGRLSFELVQKAARAGVPVLAGVSAPSSLAVELAAEAGISLIGFLRDSRFNVYTGGERIALAPAALR